MSTSSWLTVLIIYQIWEECLLTLRFMLLNYPCLVSYEYNLVTKSSLAVGNTTGPHHPSRDSEAAWQVSINHTACSAVLRGLRWRYRQGEAYCTQRGRRKKLRNSSRLESQETAEASAITGGRVMNLARCSVILQRCAATITWIH